MNDLYDSFGALPAAPSGATNVVVLETLPVVEKSPHLFAKTTEGFPCLLISTSSGPIPPAIQLEHLTVQHGIPAKVRGSSSAIQLRFTVVTLKERDATVVRLFLRFAVFLVGQLGQQPLSQDVSDEVRRFVAMLQQLRRPSSKTVQGLWAELFVIQSRHDIERWIRGWHIDPVDRHDFVLGGWRIEVKSSSSRLRKHHFSHDQLWAPRDAGLWVASVLVERSGTGSSVFDLAHSMYSKLSIDSSMILDDMLVRTLGVDFEKAAEVRYDLPHAQDSLLFFPSQRIPTLPSEVPDRISDVSYTVLLIDADGQRDIALP